MSGTRGDFHAALRQIGRGVYSAEYSSGINPNTPTNARSPVFISAPAQTMGRSRHGLSPCGLGHATARLARAFESRARRRHDHPTPASAFLQGKRRCPMAMQMRALRPDFVAEVSGIDL